MAGQIMDGERAGAREALNQFVQSQDKAVIRYDAIAWAFDALGDGESALKWFERGVKDGGGAVAMTIPFFRTITSDPRCHELLRRMNLPVPSDAN